jgi:outer membrane protein TolC
MKHVLTVAGLLVAAAPIAVAAQQPKTTRPNIAALSLADAISVARENNPGYRRAQNNRGPASWAVRNAYSSLILPSFTAAGGMSYTGPGSQTFLAQSFSQSVSTLSSFYDLSLSYQLSGVTLSQPGLAKAQQRATDADIAGIENLLITGITQQYLTVLQSIA